MNKNFELAIVVPCYNEGSRLPIKKYKEFLDTHPKVLLCFVNDGSSDTTLDVLEQLKTLYPSAVKIISLSENSGKAEAVRFGILVCLKDIDFRKIAYLDADLSTSLEECVSINEQVGTTTSFAFGSRISKIDTLIDRKRYRFLIGRCIATLISNQLDLKVYDTQCGCKIFNRELAESIFQDGFNSRWLFDVEIFHRLIALYGKEQLRYIVKEVPLQSWIDIDDSKVPFSYFFKLWYDLYKIGVVYKNPVQSLRSKYV